MQIPDDILAWAIDETRTWIEQQRELHRPAGGELPAVAKDAVRPFFPPAVLDRARVTLLPVIPNPPFLEHARDLKGLPVDGINFNTMEGVTLVDTILISQAVPPTDPLRLMFHELVHAVQYELLGVREFSRQYVPGIVEGEFDYNRIPLEVMAYDLDRRFSDNPGAAFSVLEEVRRLLTDPNGGAHHEN
jgi:hypothetical protein